MKFILALIILKIMNDLHFCTSFVHLLFSCKLNIMCSRYANLRYIVLLGNKQSRLLSICIPVDNFYFKDHAGKTLTFISVYVHCNPYFCVLFLF